MLTTSVSTRRLSSSPAERPRRRMMHPGSALVGVTLAALALTGCATQASAQGANIETPDPVPPNELPQATESTPLRTGDLISTEAPDEFTRVSTRQEHHDERPVTVTRAQRPGDTDYGSEHVTEVIDEAGILLGLTRQTAGFPEDALPSPEEAERLAFAFITGIDPEFARGLTVQWVDRHDETILGAGADPDPITVSGVKVKTRHESGLYTWVIVGSGGQIVTFERDVAWDAANARRQTAMWLHDSWIVARDGAGDEPGGEYAPIGG